MTQQRFLNELEFLLCRAAATDADICFVIGALEDALYRLRRERARYFSELRLEQDENPDGDWNWESGAAEER
jgi:hypothetical protein